MITATYNCSRRHLSSSSLFQLFKSQARRHQQQQPSFNSSTTRNPSSVITFPRPRCYHSTPATPISTTHHLTTPKLKISRKAIFADKMGLTVKATIASFGGKLFKLSHPSSSTGTDMAVNIYLPPQALSSSGTQKKVPVLIYLSGLTCTPENCSEKGFFQHGASKRGLAVVYPDTSPRGLNLPGEKDSWDFGEGAGFYVDATQEPYAKGYKMYSYITEELPKVLFGDEEFGKYLDSDKVSITGHSMGGHGALSLYLKNPGMYKSVSAFAPIANPCECAWGKKAFGGYLGEGEENKEEWKKYDSTELIKSSEHWRGNKDARVLVDVGTGDNFYKQGQLLPENFEKAVKEAGVEGVTVRYQEDYDHSYYFMASFSDDHVDHAAKYLGLL